MTNPAKPAAPRPAWETPFLTALLVATVWVACFYFPGVWTITGIGEEDKPFLDLRNILAAGEAEQLGLDPYAKNPLDPYNRPHGYTAWWLVTGSLGLSRVDTAWLGTLLLGLVLASTVLLLRPAGWREGTGLLLVLISPPLLLAINRANHDLAVFVVMIAALACFRGERALLRAAGIVLLAAAAVLKYFPLAAVVLVLEARTRRELLGWSLLYCLVLLLAWPALAPGLHVAATHEPAPSWLFAFGAPVLFRNLDLAAAPLYGWLAASGILLTGLAGWWMSAARSAADTGAEMHAPEREYAAGAVMLVGCFLHGSSYGYKLVFALWLLPWLWRAVVTPAEARWRKATWILLLAVLWFEGSAAVAINLGLFSSLLSPAAIQRLLEATLLFGQLLTWALVVCLWRGLLIYLGRRMGRLDFARG